MRFLLAFLLLGSVALPAEIDDDFASMIHRVEKLEKEVDQVKLDFSSMLRRVDALEGQSNQKCPCPTGGKCICPADGCNCPGCPNHVQPHEDAHYKILGWGASWCGPCRVGESASRADGTWDRVLHYDWDSEADRAVGQKLGVSALPTVLLVKDNKVLDRHTGSEGYAEKIREWIDNPQIKENAARLYFPPRQVKQPLKATDPEPVRIARTSPAYSYGSTGYNPVQRCTVSRLNGQRWTWPGNLGSHLQSAHGFNPAGYSHSQLVTIHDNFHNTGQSGVSSGGYSRSPVVRFSAPRQSFPARVMRSFCPTCPL